MKKKRGKVAVLLGMLVLYLALALGPLAPAASASGGSRFVTPCAFDHGGSGG